MVWGCGGVPDVFHTAHQHVRPLVPLRAILDRFS